MPDIPHKAAGNTEALFFLCDLRASVWDHKKILIISDYDGFGGTLRMSSDSHREPFSASAALCDF